MARRHTLLTPHDVTRLAEVAHCLGALEDDLGWARAAQERWGFCGVLSGTLDEPRGWTMIAPALALPTSHPLSGRSRTPECAGLVALHTDVDSQGCARHLVQTVAARLVGRASCLEAVGSRHHADCATPPVDWLESVGFTAVDDAEASMAEALVTGTARMRLDLRTTVLAKVADTVRGLVGHTQWAPVPPPEPSHRHLVHS